MIEICSPETVALVKKAWIDSNRCFEDLPPDFKVVKEEDYYDDKYQHATHIVQYKNAYFSIFCTRQGNYNDGYNYISDIVSQVIPRTKVETVHTTTYEPLGRPV